MGIKNPFKKEIKIDLGDAVVLPATHRPGFHVWKVVGIYLGALGHENLIGLKPLDLNPGSANGGTVEEAIVPQPILEAAIRSTQTP